MKRNLILSAILLVAFVAIAAWDVPLAPANMGVVMLGGGSGGGDTGLDWSNITFFANFEHWDSGADYDLATTSCGDTCEYNKSADTTGEFGGDATIATAGDVGSYSLDCVNGNDFLDFDYTEDMAQGAMGILVDITDEANNGFMLRIWQGADDSVTVSVNNFTSNVAEARASWRTDAATVINATSTAECLDSTAGYQIVEVLWDTTNNYFKVYVDNVEVISDTTTDISNFGDGGLASDINIGNETANNIGIHIDTVVVSNAYERLYDFLSEDGYDGP